MTAVELTGLGALVAGALAIGVGHVRPRWAPALAAVAAAGLAASLAFVWLVVEPAALVDLSWLPPLGSRFVLRLDPLGAPLAVFSAALAAPVLAYTAAYLPKHLADHGRPIREQARFCRLMLAFVASMVLLLLAHDLILIFAALELTALVSFLLIEFDRDEPEARHAANLALVVTAGSSLLFMAGAVIVAHAAGSTALADLTAPGVELPPIALACLAAGVLGKSAQVPLHFWLPRAMIAPTPVSAYLHSAALVAAGVFVLARLRVLLDASPVLLDVLLAIGLVSIAIGATMALAADGMKRVLAWSTIAQYGYCMLLIAIGGEHGAVGAAFFFVAHGLAKAALFLTAGAVTTVTGAHRLSETGGLFARLPALGIASAVAAAGLAGLPLTAGYFKDELFFAAAAHHGPWLAAAAVIAAALTLAYTARFWLGIFAGRSSAPARARSSDRLARLASPLTWPVALLALGVVAAGIWTAPLEPVFQRAAGVIHGAPATAVHLEYRFAPRLELWLALAAWAAGAALVWTRSGWQPGLQRAASGGIGWWVSAKPALRLAAGVQRLSDAMRDVEVRDLRDHISAVLLPAAALVGIALLAQRGWPGWGDPLELGDVAVIGGLAVTAAAALAVLRARQPLTLVLVLSFVGFGLGLTFAVAGAPDVALVIVVVETLLTILLLALLRQLPPDEIAHAPRGPQNRGPRAWIGVVASAAMFMLAWYVLAEPRPEDVQRAYLALAERAHAKDVVTAILADFRGLDTAGEITVFAVAVLGAAGVTWGRVR